MSTRPAIRRLCLSLTGSGHLLVYQLGACRTILQQCHGDDAQLRVDHVVGASGGAIAAAVLAANIPMDDYARSFIQQRGRGMKLLEEYWGRHVSSNHSSSPRSNGLYPSVSLHIATTRCQDGSSKIFSFDHLDEKERIFQCIRASCLIPPTFHPLDIVSSPSSYPEHEGLAIDDKLEGVDFFVDGGIATPAPVVESILESESITRVIISPVAGTSKRASRISPRTGGWWPQIQARHDMGLQLSWNNVKALQAASGNVSSSQLQSWYDRGQDDAGRFLDSFLRN